MISCGIKKIFSFQEHATRFDPLVRCFVPLVVAGASPVKACRKFGFRKRDAGIYVGGRGAVFAKRKWSGLAHDDL
jgi:hypothetical protein